MQSLRVAVVTVSDSRTAADDRSGDYLQGALQQAGHGPVARYLVPDDLQGLRALVNRLLQDAEVQVVLLTGGTGLARRDLTPEAVEPLLEQHIPGFGEIFRALSFEEIGPASMHSRALAGVARGKLVFCLPGSPGACRTAWEKLLRSQLDSRTRPCNFVSLLDQAGSGASDS